MTRDELDELIRNGENSGVEFKLDEVQNFDLAKEIVAFANFAGGTILLGVEDSGAVRGTVRGNLETWVMELCRAKIDPPLIPYFEWFRDYDPGKDIAVVRVVPGPDKPYARFHDNRRTYYVRVGSTSREASRDELERLFVASGRVSYGMKPVPGSTLDDLDRRRLRDYFTGRLRQQCPADDAIEEWTRLLLNLELMIQTQAGPIPSVDGMLLFGLNPKKVLPQSGVRAIHYVGNQPDYPVRADQDLRGSLVPLHAADGSILESGLVGQALDFLNRNLEPTSRLVEGRRVDLPGLPEDVMREVIVNALVHRDYSIHGADIMLSIFLDRVEITSPGRLPNTATVESLKLGFRYARNQTLVNVMRDYAYVDARGMGIRQKVIPGMRSYNDTEPEFISTDFDFTVLLWKEKPV